MLCQRLVRMSGCVSTNSPEEGSSVKPLTPCPVVSTRIVAEPYMVYPAATSLFPGCRMSDTDAGDLGFSFLYTPNMVPMETLASTLEEPSSGSNAQQYLAFLFSSMRMGCSSSSDTITDTVVERFRLMIMASLQMTSNLSWFSPCTFCTPWAPNRLKSPAHRTLEEMYLDAISMACRRMESSPVASGWCFSSFKMKCVRV
mmetsp:Transcript_27913/g.70004  ORF Transcript_27913/g.70004 Transcript_27913/m.70004 type:complete len:200 (-) Transcript_27913:85-684(-)